MPPVNPTPGNSTAQHEWTKADGYKAIDSPYDPAAHEYPKAMVVRGKEYVASDPAQEAQILADYKAGIEVRGAVSSHVTNQLDEIVHYEPDADSVKE